MAGLSVAQFGVQNLGQLIGHSLVFGIDKLRHQDLWEKSGKIVELESEFLEVRVSQISSSEAIQIGVVDGAMLEHHSPHFLVKRHGNLRVSSRWRLMMVIIIYCLYYNGNRRMIVNSPNKHTQ